MPEESQKAVPVPSAISTVGLLASALASAASTRPIVAASISAGSATTAVCGSDMGGAWVRREPPDIFTPALTVAPSGTFRDSHPCVVKGGSVVPLSMAARQKHGNRYAKKTSCVSSRDDLLAKL